MEDNVSDQPPDVAHLLQELVRSVLREVWEEFYDWNRRESEMAFKSLMNPSKSNRNTPLVNWFPPPKPISLQDVPSISISPDSEEVDEFIVYKFDGPDGTGKGEKHTLALEVAPDLIPCEPYESCLPSNRSRFVGDDSDYLPFIPFQSEDNFPHESFANEHKFFAWQNQDLGRDPNRESGSPFTPWF